MKVERFSVTFLNTGSEGAICVHTLTVPGPEAGRESSGVRLVTRAAMLVSSYMETIIGRPYLVLDVPLASASLLVRIKYPTKQVTGAKLTKFTTYLANIIKPKI